MRQATGARLGDISDRLEEGELPYCALDDREGDEIFEKDCTPLSLFTWEPSTK